MEADVDLDGVGGTASSPRSATMSESISMNTALLVTRTESLRIPVETWICFKFQSTACWGFSEERLRTPRIKDVFTIVESAGSGCRRAGFVERASKIPGIV